MHIDIIETLPSLAKLEDNWNAVYDADDEAQVFLSWQWLSGWLSCIEGPWFILAAKAGEAADLPYVAFLPLRLQTKVEKSDVISDMRMAGNYAADYTGIICRPEAENKVIPAFARTIKQMNWARLNLENVRMSERRARLLLACFPKASFNATEVDRVNKVDGIDNGVCPYLPLPKDWNGYLDSLSANTRQKIRRLLKQVDTPGEYRITVSTAETLAQDLKTLLGFWATKWRPRKGDRVDSLVRSNGVMLTRSFQSGMLFLPTFWHGDRPVAALATLVDPRKRTFSFYMTGRDETFEGPPSGVILHAFSIRHAIANGFSEYDFLRGNESYKYSFGCAERKIRCTVLETRNGRNLGGKLDPRGIADVLQQATQLHGRGRWPTPKSVTGAFWSFNRNTPTHCTGLASCWRRRAILPRPGGCSVPSRQFAPTPPRHGSAWGRSVKASASTRKRCDSTSNWFGCSRTSRTGSSRSRDVW